MYLMMIKLYSIENKHHSKLRIFKIISYIFIILYSALMFKIGNIYTKSDELNDENNELLSKHFPLIPLNSIPFDLQNDEKYEYQFQPFYYSDNFDVYKDYNEGATPGAWLLIIHTSIYDEIKQKLGMNVKTVNVRNEDDKIAKPYDDSEEDADIDYDKASCYILKFDDNNFKSKDDYIYNPESLPKTVIDYLDLECKNVCYNWNDNDYNYNLFHQFRKSIYGFIKNMNFDNEIRYIKSLEDFWNSIGNIDNFNISKNDIIIDFETECEEIRNRLKELRTYPELNINLIESLLKCVDTIDKLGENEINSLKELISSKINELINKIENDYPNINSYKLMNLLNKYSDSDFDKLDDITLILILVHELNVDVSKYYFDYEKRLKQIKIRNENMPHSRYNKYYDDYCKPAASVNYPEYKIKCEEYKTFIKNYIDNKDYNNSVLQEKELIDGDKFDETDCFDMLGALIYKYGNRYMYNECYRWFIYDDRYTNPNDLNKLKENIERYYWYTFDDDNDYIHRINNKIEIDYIYCPNYHYYCWGEGKKPKIFIYYANLGREDYEIYYAPNGEKIEDKKYSLNKYLPDIIVKSSSLFTEFRKEYSSDEIYNIDLTDRLKHCNSKDFNGPMGMPENSAEMALMIHHVISYVCCDLVDDYVKAIINNLFYLQMTDILDLIELITRKHLFNVYVSK